MTKWTSPAAAVQHDRDPRMKVAAKRGIGIFASLWRLVYTCPSSKMRLTTKVRVSNGSGGSVSGDLQIEICGMQQGVTSLLRPSRGSLYALLTQFVPLLKR